MGKVRERMRFMLPCTTYLEKIGNSLKLNFFCCVKYHLCTFRITLICEYSGCSMHHQLEIVGNKKRGKVTLMTRNLRPNGDGTIPAASPNGTEGRREGFDGVLVFEFERT